MAFSFAVEGGDGEVDGAIAGLRIGECLIGEIPALQVPPDDLDVVEFSGVFGQPLDREPVLAGGKSGSGVNDVPGYNACMAIPQRKLEAWSHH